MPHMTDKTSCPIRGCNKCDFNRKDAEKYKKQCEIAKSGLSDDERFLLLELVTNEQIKHMIPNDKYDTAKYTLLEQLKYKIKIM